MALLGFASSEGLSIEKADHWWDRYDFNGDVLYLAERSGGFPFRSDDETSNEQAAGWLHAALTKRYESKFGNLLAGMAKTAGRSIELYEDFAQKDITFKKFVGDASNRTNLWTQLQAGAHQIGTTVQSEVSSQIAWTVASYVGLKALDASLDYFKYLRMVRQLKINARVGRAGEDTMVKLLEDAGFEVVGRKIKVKTPFGAAGKGAQTLEREIDIVVRKNGKLHGIEVKTGRGPGTEQFAKDQFINRYSPIRSCRRPVFPSTTRCLSLPGCRVFRRSSVAFCWRQRILRIPQLWGRSRLAMLGLR